MAPRVRLATGADAAVLATVAGETFALACPPHVTAAAIEAFVERVLSQDCFRTYLADPDREVFLAVDGPTPLGYAMVVHGTPQDQDVAAALRRQPTTEVSKIYVLPSHHGAGTSRLLMSQCLAAAERRGSAGAWLGVNQQNERAQRFYRKSGFEQVGTKRFLVGDRYEDDYVFERAL